MNHQKWRLIPVFSSRNYRLFFAEQGISLIGTWMTQLATVWLVYDLTKSPLMLGIVGFSSQIPISLFSMLFVGLGTILQIAGSNTFLQTIVEEDKRGRLLSLYTMSFLGMIPVGNLLGGVLASHIGAPNTLIIDGIACIIGSIIFYRQLPGFKKFIYPIYHQKGIVT